MVPKGIPETKRLYLCFLGGIENVYMLEEPVVAAVVHQRILLNFGLKILNE